jgi:arylformamidase
MGYLSRRLSDESGVDAGTSVIWLGSHAGTHIDAPAHLIADGTTIDAMPVDAMIGPARVVELAGCGECALIDACDVERAGPEPGERLLLKTAGRPVKLTTGAATHLVRGGVRALGMEAHLLLDKATRAAQRHLFDGDVWIIEELDLAAATPGQYDLVCLPLKASGADAAPARALLRRRSS